MAAIDDIDLTSVASSPAVKEIRKELAFLFWGWYALHQDNKVIKVKIWFISRQIRLRDLRDVFVMIFGESQA